MSGKVLALVGCVMLAGGAFAQTSPVAVSDAWARASPSQAEIGAVYLTLQSAIPDRLTGLSTPAAKAAELHTMTMEGGVMKMRALPGIDLPAGQRVTLQPGATHIMLVGLMGPLRPGQSFPLTLHFEKAGTQEATVAVEKAGAIGPEKAAGGGMPMPMGR